MAYFIHWRRTKKKKKERKRVVAASPCRSNESWHEHPLPRSFPLSPSSPTLSAFILEVLLPFPQKHPSRLIGRHAGSHKMTRTPLFLLLGFAFQIGEFSTKDSDSWALFFLFFTAPLFCYFPCVCFFVVVVVKPGIFVSRAGNQALPVGKDGQRDVVSQCIMLH